MGELRYPTLRNSHHPPPPPETGDEQGCPRDPQKLICLPLALSHPVLEGHWLGEKDFIYHFLKKTSRFHYDRGGTFKAIKTRPLKLSTRDSKWPLVLFFFSFIPFYFSLSLFSVSIKLYAIKILSLLSSAGILLDPWSESLTQRKSRAPSQTVFLFAFGTVDSDENNTVQCLLGRPNIFVKHSLLSDKCTVG